MPNNLDMIVDDITKSHKYKEDRFKLTAQHHSSRRTSRNTNN